MTQITPPRIPSGTLELLPTDQLHFQKMLDTIRETYEAFGFAPIETPNIELTDILLTKSGGETEKQVYFVQSTGALEQKHAPDVALHFDLTVPLARYVAQYERELAFPFRRYQMQRVYRGERAQKGRFREFYQCDIDVIGKDHLPLTYEAEIPAVIYHLFKKLDLGHFRIELNNRRILAGYFAYLGLQDSAAILREIDKIDKIGVEKVKENLGLPEETFKALWDLISLKGEPKSILKSLRDLNCSNALFIQGLEELTSVIAFLEAMHIPFEYLNINLSIARGLDYYTGTIYETFLSDHPSMGSVCSGGRYDNLAEKYTKSKLPGVGISIGASRLFYQLQQAGFYASKPAPSPTQVMIACLDPAYQAETLHLAASLRDEGISVLHYLEPHKMAKQLRYADKLSIPYMIMIGEDEVSTGKITLKDLKSSKQMALEMKTMIEILKSSPNHMRSTAN